ncbi:MAG: GH1 family beta-glucosidase [Rariglobus sp.]
MSRFPKNFTWGAAAASYQIEGSALIDGKGPCVWDMFSRIPGKTYEGHTGSVACDHYHRFAEDAALMSDLGIPNYRLSVSWPRVLPTGTGKINDAGLAFYDRLIDTLLARGVQPWVTLFHWDYPYELYCRGGWLNPDSPQWFADYTQLVVDRLSDRVSHWFTINEPQCFIGLGLQSGLHAPGDKLGLIEVLRAAHHTLLAHGRAVEVIRARAKTKPHIGWAPCGTVAIPENENRPEDVAAARAAMFGTGPGSTLCWDAVTTWSTAWWADPVVLGKYPDDGLKAFGAAVPKFTDAEMKTISQPLDFYGVNIYNGTVIRADANGLPQKVSQPVGHSGTAMKWPVTPAALYWGPKFLHERYQLPVIIAENGLSCMDWVSTDGKVHDPQRIDFLRRYLRELARAIADGTDVRGYFQWSVMDNFEWAEGYKERFGLIHVDYTTQQRTPKDSSYWYRDVIQSNGATL